jgi:hypothetical protein
MWIHIRVTEAVDMNGRFQMQGGKNWFLPKEMNANRFFCDSHWLEIWSNHFYPSMGPNGVSVAMDSGYRVMYNGITGLSTKQTWKSWGALHIGPSSFLVAVREKEAVVGEGGGGPRCRRG